MKKRYLIALCLAIVPAIGSAQTTVTLAVTGDPAPGADNFFDAPSPSRPPNRRSLNNVGHIGFSSLLTDSSGVSNDGGGIYRSDGTSIIEVARIGQSSPDGNGTFLEFNAGTGDHYPIINDAGNIVLSVKLADTEDGSNDDHAFFLGDGSSLTQIVREGQSAPDGNGVLSSLDLFHHRPALNNHGQVGFLCRLNGTTGGTADNLGIFRADGTNLVQIARAGQEALGGTLGQLFHSPLLNGLGELAFRCAISGGPNGGTHILRADGNSIVSIGGPGRAIPGENGVTITTVWDYSKKFHDSGQMSFLASLAGTSDGDDYGLYRGDGNSIVEIVREGDPTPSGNGSFKDPFAGDINSSGQAAFTASLAGTSGGEDDDVGLFLGDGDSLIEIIREGQPVPDGEGSFGQRGLLFTYSPNINAAGQIAFSSFIFDDEGNRTGHGIFFFDSSTGLHQVARIGTPLLGSTISYLEFEHPDPVAVQYDLLMGFNDRGQITYGFILEDGRWGTARWEMSQPEQAPHVTDVSRTAGDLIVSFEASPGLGGWQIFGSTDLSAFSDDLTAGSQFSEPSPGNYRAIVPVAGTLQSYFVQIRR